MRWSIIRLIWFRELRDQLRDRRTVITILLLPLLLYPLLGLLVMQFALQLLDQTSTIGFVTSEPEAKSFPGPQPPDAADSPAAALAWLTLTPAGMATPVNQIGGAAALAHAGHLSFDYSLLIADGKFPTELAQAQKERLPLFPGTLNFEPVFLSPDEAKDALKTKRVDLLVAAPDDFWERLTASASLSDSSPLKLDIKGRGSDERSRRAWEQFSILLARWKTHLKEVRFHRHGLPSDFADPFRVDNSLARSEELVAAESLLELLVRTFPFMLVMWSLAGALYPAVDVCAGEKERGTMETLLISPAGREEIVLGKFLTIWVFSALTALMHLISMALATWQMRSYLPQAALTVPALLWCMLLVLPLSALFSAVGLAVGTYARSSKEGQYYLMPLFWLTMPLVFLTMAPGVELNEFYSMVPVTGVALLMQKLMIAPALDQDVLRYFAPVFATVILYSWLALRWAVKQFQREEVLFRGAERLDLMLWLRRLFRDKEPLPTAGQALFCFVMLLALRLVYERLGGAIDLYVRTIIVQLAFVAAPALIMAVTLTTQPPRSLGLVAPRAGYLAAALLLLPLAVTAHYALHQVPGLFQMFLERRSFVEQAYQRVADESPLSYLLHNLVILSLLPALCKELAFRGFILTGLRQGLAAWPTILLSSFLFAVYHMHVYAVAPLFVLGVALGWFAERSGSLLPSILLHAGCNWILLGGPLVVAAWLAAGPETVLPVLLPIAALCTGVAVLIVWKMQGKTPARLPKEEMSHASDIT